MTCLPTVGCLAGDVNDSIFIDRGIVGAGASQVGKGRTDFGRRSDKSMVAKGGTTRAGPSRSDPPGTVAIEVIPIRTATQLLLFPKIRFEQRPTVVQWVALVIWWLTVAIILLLAFGIASLLTHDDTNLIFPVILGLYAFVVWCVGRALFFILARR